MRVTSKGQVTIPVEIREQLGLRPDTEVEWEATAGAARLRKARKGSARGTKLVQRLKGRGDVPLSTDQILALTRG